MIKIENRSKTGKVFLQTSIKAKSEPEAAGSR